ncbi:multiple sugar transport system substrate-binding protein [Pseudonocardia thermophila]|uniref:Multiple sugar transport system substrate-binding protein n=2 Tax=Pseudonocardia thermophila TaxID=1848 RepID=A0A1M6WPR9_PSETH|nr:multiple sugar transport system substrate-binding protein [Pseudonocardia thermophila]
MVGESAPFGRRTFLRGVGSAGILAAISPALAACGGSSSSTWDGKLNFMGWDHQPEVIKRLVSSWSTANNVPVDVSISPNVGYAAAIQTRLRGGDPIDVFYNHSYNSERFIKQDWATPLNDLPGVDDMVANLYPSARPRYVQADGKIISVPYYSAVHLMHYNKRMVEDAGFSGPPKNLDETYAQAQKLKAGGLETPYVAYWIKEFCEEYFNVYLLSEGVIPFDDQGDPVFADDPKTVRVLEWWQSMYRDGLAASSVLTDDPGKLSTELAQGRAAFFVLHHYFLTAVRELNGPESPNLFHAPVSATGETLQIGDVLQMGTITNEDRKARAWDLMKYYGWKDVDGKFTVLTEWAKSSGLVGPYSDFFDDPAVIAAFPDYYDLKFLSATFGTGSNVMPVRNQSWYSAFQMKVGDHVHNLLLGNATPTETVKALTDAAKAAKKGGGL